MQLILDYQVGRPQHGYPDDPGGGRVGGGLVTFAFPVLGCQVVGHESVPFTSAADAAEQRGRLTLPGQLSELVHRADQQRGRVPVDLLVDDQHP
ncbi:MAG: hypothetical protein ACRDRN_27350 [Sciscionella sp.]